MKNKYSIAFSTAITDWLRILARLLTRVVPGLNSWIRYMFILWVPLVMFNVLLICRWDYIDFNFNETTSKGARCRCHFFFLCFIFLDSAGVPLMQCLMPLLKRVRQGIGGKTVVALFRILFWYYKHHWDSELEREIYKWVSNVSSMQPSQ